MEMVMYGLALAVLVATAVYFATSGRRPPTPPRVPAQPQTLTTPYPAPTLDVVGLLTEIGRPHANQLLAEHCGRKHFEKNVQAIADLFVKDADPKN